MRVVRLFLLGGGLALGAACSLNPQPLPPDKPVDAGFDVNQLGATDAATDGAFNGDVALPPPEDASVDAPPSGDASSSDASEDAADAGDSSSDAGFDAEDGDGA